MIPNWAGERVAILASGPSLRAAPIDAIGRSGCRILVINNSWTLVPWASALYAADLSWWRHYNADVARWFAGMTFTQDETAAADYGIDLIRSVDRPGLSRDPRVIHQGGNSGYQAIGLAHRAGAAQILLFGFDMHGDHWHGPHREEVAGHLTTRLDFAGWIPRFDALAADLEAVGVETINCTPGSALRCFRSAEFEA